MSIQNPILTGFNPDPAICRAGADYYIATSTFEWWPGVQLHHSRDLVNWELVGHALTRPEHIDLVGNPNSGGVWAPCLTYADGLFWLIYSNVRTWQGPYKDVHNYLITAPSIEGPWSDPIFLNSSGFDPSLFHDEDGRKWVSNQRYGHLKHKSRFDGILLQEYDLMEQTLVGPVKNIFPGVIGGVEGPHIYRKDGWYFLMTAEGGTGVNHAVTLARSKDIWGPYEVHPDNPMLTAKGTDARLQKAGHGSWIETQTGDWYLVHLCGRPLPGLDQKRCTLGRETAIQKFDWHKDGWPRLIGGSNLPADEVPAPDLPPFPVSGIPSRHDFDGEKLSPHLASLRDRMNDSWCSLSARPGYLRLKGRESLLSRFHQSLIAQRVQSFDTTASTCLEFEPFDDQQMAGLVFFYDTNNYVHLYFTSVEGVRRINVKHMDLDKEREVFVREIPTGDVSRVYLKGHMAYHELRLYWSLDGESWNQIDEVFDASKLSDEYRDRLIGGNFTGAFAGICCQDLSGQGLHADFDWFEMTVNA